MARSRSRWATGYRLRPGHRLRLHLASSDFPLYNWRPGTAENPWHAIHGRRNEQAIHGRRNEQLIITGGSAPSYLSMIAIAEE